jgi:hypothetical protein
MYLDGLIELLKHSIMEKIWILIHVHRGLIQEPEIFFDEKSAEIRKQIIMKDFNPDYDEIGIYVKEV